MQIKSFFFNISCRFLDSLTKFVLYLTLPFALGYSETSLIHIFLSFIFITSVIFRMSSENLILKKLSILNFDIENFKIFVRDTLYIIFKGYLVFILIIFILQNFSDHFQNNLTLKMFNDYNVYILINSLVFTIIAIVSFGLRALGRINLSILSFGSIWPILLILIIVIKVNFNYDLDFIVKYFTLFFFSFGVLLLIYFYKLVNQKKNSNKSIMVNELKLDRKNSYIQSISSLFINWVPLVIFGLFNDEITTGIFGTYFKIGLGFFYFLNVIDFISIKNISDYFQTNDKIKIKETFEYYKKIKIGLALTIMIGSIIFLSFYNFFLNTQIVTNEFYIFLTILLIASIFGPVDIIFFIINKENILARSSIFFIISILFCFTPAALFFDHSISLYIFSVLFFLNYLYKHQLYKKEINF